MGLIMPIFTRKYCIKIPMASLICGIKNNRVNFARYLGFNLTLYFFVRSSCQLNLQKITAGHKHDNTSTSSLLSAAAAIRTSSSSSLLS